MNRKFRFAVAALLVGILALTAAGVWAAPAFRGTVPKPPHEGNGGGGDDGETATCKPVDMATAIFTSPDTGCIIKVEAVDSPEGLASAPEGKAFVGDTFTVTTKPATSLVKICYAYPPEFAAKDAGIYKLTTVPPPVWDEVPGAVISNGVICVTTSSGTFSLIGNP